eukprot:TRINITY_DN50778_c0_g1_i1.p2 TRINITY_DN50778_c0_g1~~TRINITY_DN50778_c0_g1_i1.p2  ORF type:complete len:217 (+),score=102.35 TRINITY_DN50778_c0_g1_i1:217-867(+)
MQRLFGKSNPKSNVPAPTIEDTQDRMDKRVTNVDSKIKKYDDDLAKLSDQIKRARPGPAQQRLKQRAMQVLKQKRMYEGQRDQIENQRFNMDEMAFAMETVRDTHEQVQCLKATATQLKTEHKKLDVGDVEKLQDELQDLYDDNQEIQEILGRNYAVQDDIDDAELEAELAGLEDDLLCSNDASYLDDALAVPTSDLPAKKEEETDPSRLEQQLGL